MSITRAYIEDRGNVRTLTIQQCDDDGRNTIVLKRARLTGGKRGKGTWPEVDAHLAELNLTARGWRRMNYDMRTVCEPAT